MSLITASVLRDRHGDVCLLDVRPASADHASGHLPGALHADLNRHLSTACDPGHDPARGGRHPLPPLERFAAQVGAWGIGPDTEVVAYDAVGGGNAAARLWWMLRALGHTRVSVLDGGLQAALASGFTLTQEPATIASRPPYPVDRWRLPLVDAEAVETLRRDPSRKLMDARSSERWRGENETLDPLPGHIPGSVNLYWAENLGPDGRFTLPLVVQGTNLKEKYLDISVVEGATTCKSPYGSGGVMSSQNVTINGITFLQESAMEGAAGNLYDWFGYSTVKGNACISLTFVLHALDAGAYSTPPPVFDLNTESAVFSTIMSTYANQ